MVETGSHSLVVIVVFVTLEDLHLDKRQLVRSSSAQRAEVVRDLFGEICKIALVKRTIPGISIVFSWRFASGAKS